jgi:uncharacterized protein (DUF885 family)
MTVDVYELSDRLVDEFVELSPIEATYAGIAGHDHEWDDLSPAGVEAREKLLTKHREAFAAIPSSEDPWQRLAARVGREFLDQQLDSIFHHDVFRDFNMVASPYQMLREVFDHMEVSTVTGWGNVAARMETLHEALDGYRRTLDSGREQGFLVARRQVLAGIDDARLQAGERSFFARAPGRLNDWDGNPPAALRARLEEASRSARQAFADFGDYLEHTYLPDAQADDGVGRERYVRHARKFLGMDIDPSDTYRWGWSEVSRLHRRMVEVARQIDPGANLSEVVDMLKTDPLRCASSPDEFVELMGERQQRALQELNGVHFDIPESIKKLNVKVAPAGGALGAYYVQPSEDFSRPGTVWYSLGERQRISLWDEVSTAYHEGFPGHHVQCGVQLALGHRLSRLHRVIVWLSGYGEGWALYAERLMDELGYLEKPEYQLGMLAGQMLRACRVVIDIGMHVGYPIPADAVFRPGEEWSFGSAVEMLADCAFVDEDHAVSEVTRYLGWPGQAISYKVGERVILELREEMRNRQGAGFDLKEFHSRVLGSGPVGLDHLRELVLEA